LRQIAFPSIIQFNDTSMRDRQFKIFIIFLRFWKPRVRLSLKPILYLSRQRKL